MGEPHKMQFYQGVLGTCGDFHADDGWTHQAIHVPSGKSLADLHATHDPWDLKLAPGTRMIVHGRLKHGSVKGTIVEVFQVFVQEELE